MKFSIIIKSKQIIKYILWFFLLILGVFLFSVFYYYKFDKNLFFKCPDKFSSSEEYVMSVAEWSSTYLKDHPNATQEEISSERVRLLREFNCEESPFGVVGTIPEMSMPLKYFSDKDIAWGSGDPEDKNKMDYAVLDTGYQSFPTKDITLSSKDYSNEIKDLPLVKSNKEIFKVGSDGKVEWDWLYKDQIKEYGDLAYRFIPEGYTIVGLEKFDVDGDGKNETIISLCGTGGNHCPHQIIVVKGNKIIFTADAGLTGLDITKNDSDNGFYMHWVPSEGEEWDTGLCCPPGYMKTRFVYENGIFKPLYEQKVLYFKVNNKK